MMQYEKKFIEVNNKTMAYIDSGEGEVFLFLHGNPTSSFLWRNIAPHVEDLGRIVIPDLIGMGDSEKLEIMINEAKTDLINTGISKTKTKKSKSLAKYFSKM